MAEDGIVGEYNGSQARDVLITLEQWAEMQGEKPDSEPPQTPRPKLNRILPASDDERDEDDDDFDDDPPFDDGGGDEDGDDEDSDDESENTLPVRGPHRTTAAGRSAASARLHADIEEDADRECDEEGESSEEDEDDETNESSEDIDSDDVDSDGAAQESEDERYAHINPALMARLRAKRMRDRQQRLRRSA
jgi:hypothetical protein